MRIARRVDSPLQIVLVTTHTSNWLCLSFMSVTSNILLEFSNAYARQVFCQLLFGRLGLKLITELRPSFTERTGPSVVSQAL